MRIWWRLADWMRLVDSSMQAGRAPVETMLAGIMLAARLQTGWKTPAE